MIDTPDNMALWKLEPVARPDDPRWQDYPIWREVVVRAASAGEARALAAELEATPEQTSGNESISYGSRLADEKMYSCRQVHPDDAGETVDGDPGVLSSDLLREARQP
ncbi:MAG: hypothetical protein R3316_04700 [Rhodovibrionaceae bacterium]|nr:hypothetical protein [Rhodovibrionaceae bacterium]